MCGLSGILINCQYSPTNILNHLDKSLELDDLNENLTIIKKLTKIFKNENLYFEYINDHSFKKKFLYKKKSLEKKLLNNNLEKSDFYFTLNETFKNKLYFIEKNLSTNKSYFEISFLFNLSFIVNSINLIEIRGRDSLGVSIKVEIEGNYYKPLSSNSIVFIKNKLNRTEISFCYKTYNLIGKIGDNSSEILKQIFKDNSLLKIIRNFKILNIYFHAHTRWASMGNVNLHNCHPIQNFSKNIDIKSEKLQISVNGDITNYKELTKLRSYMQIDNCDSDTRGILNLLSSYKILDTSMIKEALNKTYGSYSFVIENLSSSKITIGKSGNQGLYLSYTDNKIIYSSDIYGFIELSNFFLNIPAGFIFELSFENILQHSFIFSKFSNNDKTEFLNFSREDFSYSPIGFKDVHRGKYEHYFLKELYETCDVVKKTYDSFIFDKNFVKNFNNTNAIIKKTDFTNFSKKYEEIVITGMGTCYTAAVAISQKFRDQLRKNGLEMSVEPHVASEGSAFYLKKDMSKTLVIVIAQSGTTIDTNVYVELASKRGAKTLALVNKRDGDLTFLVNNILYIGDGRDIEISVPSTKTYIAHIFLAEIFITYILFLNKKVPYSKQNYHFLNIKKKNILINDFVLYLKKMNLKKKNLNEFLIKKKWIIAYEDYQSEAAAQEIRIKFSESCYTVVPIFSVEFIIQSKYTNTLIIFIRSKNKTSEKYKFDSSNFIFQLGSDKDFKASLNIQKKYHEIYEYALVMIGQYLSYHVAKSIDERTKLFVKKQKYYYLTDRKNLIKFQKGFSKYEYLKISKNQINQNIFNKTIRSIDTIKHQAKTITVGATRNTYQKFDKKFELIQKNKINVSFKNDICLNLSLENFDEVDSNLLINHLNQNYSNDNYIFKHIKDYDLNYHIKIPKKTLINICKIKFGENHEYKISYNKNEFSYTPKKQLESKLIDQKISIIELSNFILNKILEKKISLNNKTSNYFSKINKFSDNLDLKIIKKISKYLTNFDEIKFIGSGTNYNTCKYIAQKINQLLKLNIAWDVLENHKHIDISSEPLLFVFIANINNFGYQNDAKSEIDKFISHNNKVIIFTDKKDKRFIKSKDILDVVYIPTANETLNHIYLSVFFEKITNIF